jgi:hypothetical protein
MDKGSKHSKESRLKMSKSRLGVKQSEESKRKRSISLKGKIPWNKGLTKETDERVRILSEKIKGFIPWNKGKKMSQESIDKRVKNTNYKSGKEHYNYGRHWKLSEQTKKNIGEGHKKHYSISELELKRKEKKIYMKQYRQENKDSIKDYSKEYSKKYIQDPKVKLRMKKYKEKYNNENRKKISERGKLYRQRPEVKAYNKINNKKKYQRNKNLRIQKSKEYYQNHRELIKIRMKKYYQIPETRIIVNERLREKMKSNPQFAIKERIRNLLKTALQTYSKTGKIMSTSKYGVDYEKIIEHLKPFPKNREDYHIDHIIPVSWFDFNNSQEIKWAFDSCNLQWLTKEENLKKGNRYILVADRTIKNDI